jgi:alginate O-acetyltransferase complex protein AlgI
LGKCSIRKKGGAFLSFASLTFLYFFLPFTLLGYYLLPRAWRNGFLLAANLLFYAWGEPSFLVVILATTVINFYAAKRMQANPAHKKRWAIGAAVFDLGLLGIFKYTGFLLDILRPVFFWADLPTVKIPLPLGISFYTFQVLSYIIDVYRQDTIPQRSFTRFSTYMTLFPQLIAGPIIRYRDLASQLGARQQTLARFSGGIRLLLVGLGKKVLLANQMGALWEALKVNPTENGILGAWLGAIAFTLQIYFDFSGYSDMARGLGKLFAFELPINFDYPYISRSISEFWRRWHISLGTWFRDYVYIPLGGSRKGPRKTICNLLVVWALTGLWHGASWNFVLWGLYYFALLALEKRWLANWLRTAPRLLTHGYAMIFVTFGWVLFAFDDFGALEQYIRCLLLPNGSLIGHHAAVLFFTYLPLLIVAIAASLPMGKHIFDRFRTGKAAALVEIVSGSMVLLLCTAALVAQTYNPFLYFRF